MEHLHTSLVRSTPTFGLTVLRSCVRSNAGRTDPPGPEAVYAEAGYDRAVPQ